MKPINHDDLIKLDERLDSLLSNKEILKAAKKSKSEVFRAAAELIQAEHPKLDDSARARMRAKMLAAVPAPVAQKSITKTKAKPQAKPILRPSFVNWAARIAAVFVIMLVLGLMTPPALANSLPGDALYPMKRGVETIELAFANNPVSQVDVHFKQSERRLDENKRLLEFARFDSTVMQDALTSLNTAIQIANDNNLFVTNFALEQRANRLLMDIQDTLAVAEEQALVNSADYLRLAQSESEIMSYLPSMMADPSNSSEVSTLNVSSTEEDSAAIIVEASEESLIETVDSESSQALEDETLLFVNASGRVNVRSGAGTAYDVIARINPNAEVMVLAVSGDWTRIRLENGMEGWIANFLLSETRTPNHADTSTDAAGNGEAGSGTNVHGCEEHGNSCNANGNTNGNATGNANGNSNNSSGNATGNTNGNSNGRGDK